MREIIRMTFDKKAQSPEELILKRERSPALLMLVAFILAVLVTLITLIFTRDPIILTFVAIPTMVVGTFILQLLYMLIIIPAQYWHLFSGSGDMGGHHFHTLAFIKKQEKEGKYSSKVVKGEKYAESDLCDRS